MIELGLQRVSRLLSKTHLPWRAIHVAGTNGKGSICVYISGMLEAYNNSAFRTSSKHPRIRHGRFTSPHLIDRWDCISINQQPVSSALFHEIEKKVLLRNASEKINASEFELLTATAFEIFTHENVDIGVIEVGMGGRLDATNILGQEVVDEDSQPSNPAIRAQPLVTAIAKIGLDHQSFLGSTLEAIAAEKAGILKPNVPLAYDASNPPEVTSTFTTLAAKTSAPISHLTDLNLPTTSPSLLHQTLPAIDLAALNLPPSPPTPDSMPTPQHTKQNTSVALHTTLLALSRLSLLPLPPPSDLLTSLLSVPRATTFPGRQQPLSITPLTGRAAPILLDGAHNAQSALVLAETVERLRSASASKQVTWLLAASDSKDVAALLRPLLRGGDAVFAVEFGDVEGMPWVKAMAGEKVLEAARSVAGVLGREGVFGRDLVAGLRAASEAAGEEGVLVVAGSLYLVGGVLGALREAEGERKGGE